MTTGEGESAVSTGPMVPVLASNDEGRSRAALGLLEAHGIPAILDADLEGGFVGFHDPVPAGWLQVLVPLRMRAEAIEVLRKVEGESGRRARPPSAFEVPRPPSRGLRSPTPIGAELGLRALQRGVSIGAPPVPSPPPTEAGLALGDEPDEERTELLLPAPDPTSRRLSIALAAIAFGGAVQQVLGSLLGPQRVVELFAARADHWTELHRLVTASFLHGGAPHFLSNAAFGLVFGVVLFGTHGVGAAALVWLLSSAVGLGAEIALSPEVVVLGASAGNYGLVGLWTRGQLERARLSLLPRRERVKTIGLLLLLVPGALTPFSSTGSRIAVLAHVAGFAAGYLAGLVLHRRLLPEGLELIEERSRLCGQFAIVVTVIAWAAGVLVTLAAHPLMR